MQYKLNVSIHLIRISASNIIALHIRVGKVLPLCRVEGFQTFRITLARFMSVLFLWHEACDLRCMSLTGPVLNNLSNIPEHKNVIASHIRATEDIGVLVSDQKHKLVSIEMLTTYTIYKPTHSSGLAFARGWNRLTALLASGLNCGVRMSCLGSHAHLAGFRCTWYREQNTVKTFSWNTDFHFLCHHH